MSVPHAVDALWTRLGVPVRRAVVFASRWPWWVQVLAVWAVSRLWSGAVLLAAARQQTDTYWSEAHPPYLTFVGSYWDSDWYRQIAEGGYPDGLPTGDDGAVVQNKWAFFPLFPLLVRGLMQITGGSWTVVAPILATVLGAGAALMVNRAVRAGMLAASGSPRVTAGPGAAGRGTLAPVPPWGSAPAWPGTFAVSRHDPQGPAHGLVEQDRPGRPDEPGGPEEPGGLTTVPAVPVLATADTAALATVTLVFFFPSSPVLQIAYTESLALLGIASFLWLIVRRHYVWAMPVALALGFTRAVALPLAVVVAVHAVVRWRRRRTDPVRPGEWAAMAACLAVAVASGFVWQVVVGLATGRPDAFLATQAAWRAGGVVLPVVPWFTIGQWLFGNAGFIVVPLVCLGAAAVVLSRPAWRLGPELQVFAAAYLAYMVGVTEPGTSLARFLILAFPLGTITALASKSRAYLAVVVGAFALMQIVWVVWLWQLNSEVGWAP